jgi:glyoxylase-like metal-dependent hydrolase (beta-lactamase superfamily II)
MSYMYAIFLFAVAFALTIAVQAQQSTDVFRVNSGSLEVIALQDGVLKLGPDGLKGIEPAVVRSLLGNYDPVPTSVNAFVVRSGGHTVLVDAGGRGKALGGELGHVADLLRQAGISPDSIEAILITHLHFDHIDGLLTADGKRVFPNAVLRMAQAEYDYWMDPAREATSGDGQRTMLHNMKAALAAYQAQGACRPFVPGESPFPGVTAVAAPGHTPGHTAYVVNGGKETSWFVGDIVHFGKVQFARPEAVVPSSDVDSVKAAATRIDLLKRASTSKAILAGAHMDFPGMGRVVAKGTGFDWVPLPR